MSIGLRWLARLEQALLGTILLVMVVFYSGAVLLREVSPDLAQNIAWVDEATRYLLVWMIFLGLGIALQRGKHIAMAAYLDRLGPGLQQVLRKCIDIAGLAFCLYVAWIGIEITRLIFATGQRSPTLGISAGLLYLALPVGFALLALRYAASLFGLLDERWFSEAAFSEPHPASSAPER